MADASLSTLRCVGENDNPGGPRGAPGPEQIAAWAEESVTSRRQPRLPKATILLVDDNPANLLALEAVLEPLGQSIVRARSGEEALQLVAQHTFALLILDVRMPGVDGFETAALLRKHYPSRPIPLIFLSAVDPSARELARGYAHGAVDYLVKPFDPDILRSKAAVFVELFLQREEIQRQAKLLVAHERERAFHAEQTRVLEATRQAERRFRSLIAATTQIVWTTNAEGRQVEDSPSWRAFTGHTEEEWLSSGTLTSALHPDDRVRARQTWLEAVANRRPFELEYRLRRADGVYRHVAARGVPVLNDEGAICEWVGTLTDIEDRKQMDAEIEANMILREQLLAIVGHDLQNPLTAILFDSQKLLQRGGLSATESKRAARIASSADRMSRMITQLLDLSRARMGGGIPVELQETSLSAVCRAAIEELEAAHPERAIVYEESGALTAQVDADRMGEVVSNLVGNALQHGGQSTVTVRLHAIASDAVLEVHNFGDPIPLDVFPHLFDPFRRGKREAKSHSLGLGLFIAQQIVEAHGGTLTVTSTSEDGTRFTARLPLQGSSR